MLPGFVMGSRELQKIKHQTTRPLTDHHNLNAWPGQIKEIPLIPAILEYYRARKARKHLKYYCSALLAL
ncbi:hypothetical protein ACFL35_19810 [Candidatus Riflebacteria bacterium]